MTAVAPAVCVVGAGRMGRGIALAFAFGGVPAVLIDVKDRTIEAERDYFTDIRAVLEQDLRDKVELGRITAAEVHEVLGRMQVVNRNGALPALTQATMVFEAVPEIIDVKRELFAWLGTVVPSECVIASTTSTFLVTELAPLMTQSSRFINAHWLNPADVMPLVEISRSPHTDPGAVQAAVDLLQSIGKVAVVCNASAGYVVPRLQALVMNEAARMVEEGVATAEDIDRAVRVGFGTRFAVLGMLEFIDWGGGDILHYASRYLTEQLGDRFTAPDIIEANMTAGRTGIRDGQGFYSYDPEATTEYRARRMGEFWRQLDGSGLAPKFNAALDSAPDAAPASAAGSAADAAPTQI